MGNNTRSYLGGSANNLYGISLNVHNEFLIENFREVES